MDHRSNMGGGREMMHFFLHPVHRQGGGPQPEFDNVDVASASAAAAAPAATAATTTTSTASSSRRKKGGSGSGGGTPAAGARWAWGRLVPIYLLAVSTGLGMAGIQRYRVNDAGDVGAAATTTSSSSSSSSHKNSTIRSSSSTAGDTLPQCDELMRRTHSPFRDGSFLTSYTTPIHWVPRDDGSRQLELGAICSLKRYTSSEANQCLAHQHLSMIGDSISRYQYMSLTYFLENGKFPARFGRTRTPASEEQPCPYRNSTGHPQCSTPDNPTVCDSDDWPSWDAYFAALGGGGDGGGDGADRGRSSSSPMNGHMEALSVYPAARVSTLQESDTYLYVNGHSRATLSFLFEYGRNNDIQPLQGFNFSDCASTGSCRRTDDTVRTLAERALQRDFDWSQALPDAVGAHGVLRHVLPPPDVAVYNRGHWGRLSEARAQAVLPALYDWVVTSQTAGSTSVETGAAATEAAAKTGSLPRCYYKSTTAGHLSLQDGTFQYELHHVRPHAHRAECSYLDYAYLTETFAALDVNNVRGRAERHAVFLDEVHYQPWVYEELNQMLLNVLCNEKELGE